MGEEGEARGVHEDLRRWEENNKVVGREEARRTGRGRTPENEWGTLIRKPKISAKMSGRFWSKMSGFGSRIATRPWVMSGFGDLASKKSHFFPL